MHTICNNQGPSYKWSSGGTQRNKLHEGQGGLPGLSPLRSVGYQGSQAGRLDHVSCSQRLLKEAIRLKFTPIRWFLGWPGREAGPGDQRPRTLKTKLSSRGTTRLESTQIRWSHGSQTGGWTRWPVPKILEGKLISSFRQPGDLV